MFRLWLSHNVEAYMDKRNSRYALIAAVCAVCVVVCAALLDAAEPRFGDIVRQGAAVRAIDAEIVQYIDSGAAPREVFRGRYRADEAGNFRIDYSAPSRQIVIKNSRGLFWYYPDDRLLYEIARRGAESSKPQFNPLHEFARDFERRFDVRYRGKRIYGVFRRAHRFDLVDRASNLRMTVWVDPADSRLLEKNVRDPAGREIMKELYGDYLVVKGILFPRRVEVSALTARGVTKNITHYKNITLNPAFHGAVFTMEYPRNVTRKAIHE